MSPPNFFFTLFGLVIHRDILIVGGVRDRIGQLWLRTGVFWDCRGSLTRQVDSRDETCEMLDERALRMTFD